MLKKKLLSIMAAAAMTACSQVETTSVNPDPEGTGYITFSPVVPKATRGTVTKIDQLKTKVSTSSPTVKTASISTVCWLNIKEAADDNKGAGFYLPGKYSWPSYELTFSAWIPHASPQTEAAPRPMTRTAT
ncbi:MAG: fimbrillin family protein [Alistipes senegalensis]